MEIITMKNREVPKEEAYLKAYNQYPTKAQLKKFVRSFRGGEKELVVSNAYPLPSLLIRYQNRKFIVGNIVVY